MSLSGVVKRIEVNSTGLDCCVELDFGDYVGCINCYVLLAKCYEPYILPNEVNIYVEDDEFVAIKVGDEREFNLSVVFANDYSKESADRQEIFEQPIIGSSTTKFVATVKKIMDKNMVICSIGKLGDIIVNFEREIGYLKEDDRIEFGGEIKAELSRKAVCFSS